MKEIKTNKPREDVVDAAERIAWLLLQRVEEGIAYWEQAGRYYFVSFPLELAAGLEKLRMGILSPRSRSWWKLTRCAFLA